MSDVISEERTKGVVDLSSSQNQTVDKLKSFSEQEPEIIFQWKDKKSSARGYLVINSLKGNAAGGGTRVHENVTVDEVVTLAKIMEIKFALSGPAIGGAKTGIKLDPSHPQKYEILERWYKALYPILKEYYGTGSDLNTDIHKINNILQGLGINNSQEGIINAFTAGNNTQLQAAFENMRLLKAELELGSNKALLAEMVTGYGVSATVLAYYNARGESVSGKRVFVQGAGNVGAAAAYYLHAEGAKIVALTDRDVGVINKDGFSDAEISKVLAERRVLNILENNLTHDEFNKQLSATGIDVFIPAARSNVVTKDQLSELISNGLDVVSCGANHPFVESEYCYGLCSQYVDRKIALLPDFLANMGMARTFYAMMKNPCDMVTKDFIFQDIKETIQDAVAQAYANHNGKLLTSSLYGMALDNISCDIR